jgi:hypothetical protein
MGFLGDISHRVTRLTDDGSGLECKDIGAKTVHQPFIDDPRTRVELDESEPMYRITVMRRVGG